MDKFFKAIPRRSTDEELEEEFDRRVKTGDSSDVLEAMEAKKEIDARAENKKAKAN